jgi:hypothetical protein
MEENIRFEGSTNNIIEQPSLSDGGSEGIDPYLFRSPIITNRNKKNLGYNIIKTKKITSTTDINFGTLLGFIGFPTDKKLFNIQKITFVSYCKDNKISFKKNDTLLQLLDKIKIHLNYDVQFNNLIRKIKILQNNFRKYINNYELRLKGPGIPINKCVNTECPFTFEDLCDISLDDIITWRAIEDDKIYGCSFSSLFTLFKKNIIGNYANITKTHYETYMTIINQLDPNIAYWNKSKTSTKAFITILSKYKTHPIFKALKNPYTREPIHPELIYRMLKIAKTKNLIKENNKKTKHSRDGVTHRIRTRNSDSLLFRSNRDDILNNYDEYDDNLPDGNFVASTQSVLGGLRLQNNNNGNLFDFSSLIQYPRTIMDDNNEDMLSRINSLVNTLFSCLKNFDNILRNRIAINIYNIFASNNIGRSLTLDGIYNHLNNIIPVQNSVIEEITRLGFYIPENTINQIILPISNNIYNLSIDENTNVMNSIIDSHTAILINNYRNNIGRLLDCLNIIFENPVFIRACLSININTSDFYLFRNTRVSYNIRNIITNYPLFLERLPQEITEETRSLYRHSIPSRGLSFYISIIWTTIIYIIRNIFIIGKEPSPNSMSGEPLINESDRQTIAILLISTLVQAGHLSADFDLSR